MSGFRKTRERRGGRFFPQSSTVSYIIAMPHRKAIFLRRNEAAVTCRNTLLCAIFIKKTNDLKIFLEANLDSKMQKKAIWMIDDSSKPGRDGKNKRKQKRSEEITNVFFSIWEICVFLLNFFFAFVEKVRDKSIIICNAAPPLVVTRRERKTFCPAEYKKGGIL